MNRTMNKTMKTVAIDRFGGLNEMKICAVLCWSPMQTKF